MKKRERFMYFCLVVIGLLATAKYVLWWFKPEHIPSNWFSVQNGSLHFIDILLFTILSFVILFGFFLKVGTWFAIWFIKRPMHMEPVKNLKVAFVTCYVPGKEPIEMLKETLVAMKNADYKHDTWVLDEGDNTDVKKMCKDLGVLHFSRGGKLHYNQDTGPFRIKTKAGNLNSWRSEFEKDYDVVAQIDMDHVPHKDFLTMTLGYFNDEKVGYVGMPQIYKNTNNWIAKGAAEQSHFYYGPLQQGFYGAQMPFLIGTSHLYRVKAMGSFGGYSPNIAEDYLTGMFFLSHGWKGVYVPKVLAEGLGPTTWLDYFNQQMRWSYGLFEILFKHTRKHFFKLSFKQKINLTFSQMFYFTGLTTFFGFVLISLYLFFGINPTNMEVVEWCWYALPAYFSGLAIYLFLHRYYINPKSEPRIGFFGMFLNQAASIIYTSAFFKFISNQKLVYKVTSKNNALTSRPGIKPFVFHIIIFLISIAAWNVSVVTGHDSLIMRSWSLINIIFLYVILLTGYWESVKHKFYKKEEAALENVSVTALNYGKYDYVIKNPLYLRVLYFIGIVTWFFTLYGFFQFLNLNPIYWLFFGPILGLITFHNILNYGINIFYKRFDVSKHESLVKTYWGTHTPPSVDIFLPVCGEKIDILKNTFYCVRRIDYSNFNTYVLDDKGDDSVKKLAEEFGFKYLSRPNKGDMKKAGNLLYGFNHSDAEFYAVFDADFCPHPDFINDLLPYMGDEEIGLVQSPHYFEIGSHIHKKSPIEYGSANLQEQFFRTIQVARDRFGGAICAGSNTIYRRSALDKNGGPAQVDHGEDVNTGLDLINLGYKIKYVPVILAKGLSPDTLQSFYKQQNRWASSSTGLFLSGKIFKVKLTLAQRLCYLSGITYYMTQIVYFLLPIQLFVVLGLHSGTIDLVHSAPFVPYMVFSMVLLPLFSRKSKPKFGTHLAVMSSVYAHTYTIILRLFGKKAEWVPTNAMSNKIESGFSFLNNFSLFFISAYIFGIAVLVYRWNLPIFNVTFFTLIFWSVWNMATHLIYFFQTHRIIYIEKAKNSLLSVLHKRNFNTWIAGRYLTFSVVTIFLVGSFIYSAKVTGNRVFFDSRDKIIADQARANLSLATNDNQSQKEEVLGESSESNVYTDEARAGDSLIRMTKRIVRYWELDTGRNLGAEQKLFMENDLASKVLVKHIKVGFVLQFTENELEESLVLSQKGLILKR